MHLTPSWDQCALLTLMPFCNNSDKHYNSPCNISSLTWKAYGLPSHTLDGYFVKPGLIKYHFIFNQLMDIYTLPNLLGLIGVQILMSEESVLTLLLLTLNPSMLPQRSHLCTLLHHH